MKNMKPEEGAVAAGVVTIIVTVIIALMFLSMYNSRNSVLHRKKSA